MILFPSSSRGMLIERGSELRSSSESNCQLMFLSPMIGSHLRGPSMAHLLISDKEHTLLVGCTTSTGTEKNFLCSLHSRIQTLTMN